ncbi:hypothetical protein [Vibrio rotiferianus]|uniref:hypothetical protein n=1 Tax=Vibrio rotiferianus TaxID=190895 RepID=UPI001302B3BA|nr:hypothetical protein [Vibrio rotiferianus]
MSKLALNVPILAVDVPKLAEELPTSPNPSTGHKLRLLVVSCYKKNTLRVKLLIEI